MSIPKVETSQMGEREGEHAVHQNVAKPQPTKLWSDTRRRKKRRR